MAVVLRSMQTASIDSVALLRRSTDWIPRLLRITRLDGASYCCNRNLAAFQAFRLVSCLYRPFDHPLPEAAARQLLLGSRPPSGVRPGALLADVMQQVSALSMPFRE